MQIILNSNKDDMKVEKGQLIINIDSDTERLLLGMNKIELSNVESGKVFKDHDNVEYIVLEHLDDGTTAVLRKDLLEDRMEFGSDNNWKNSGIRKYLNEGYLESLVNAFGAENIVEHTVDLLSLDGLDDYGTTKDKISLLTIDQYRKYRKVIGEDMESWWWLSTSDSTPSGWSASCVQCVDDDGSVRYCGGDCSVAVRPFCILKSSIFVSLAEA